MSKLDDLIAQLESPQPFERALVLAELHRLQARERRLEELENRLLRLAEDDEREAKQHSDGGRAFRAAAAAYRDDAARIRAILEET